MSLRGSLYSIIEELGPFLSNRADVKVPSQIILPASCPAQSGSVIEFNVLVGRGGMELVR